MTFFLGETIPIRLFLGGFDLTPTFREVNKKYSTRYYLSLVLIDEGQLALHLSTHTVTHVTVSPPHRLLTNSALRATVALPHPHTAIFPMFLHLCYES